MLATAFSSSRSSLALQQLQSCGLVCLLIGCTMASPIQQRLTPGELASGSYSGMQQVSSVDGAAVTRFLNDPNENWQQDIQDPDFVLMNEEKKKEQIRRRRQFPSFKQHESAPSFYKSPVATPTARDLDLMLEEYLLYAGQQEQAEAQRRPGLSGDRAEFVPVRSGSDAWTMSPRPVKRGKLYSLSLTNNLDVLREKLYMEIARRNRLSAQNQIESVNNALVTMG